MSERMRISRGEDYPVYYDETDAGDEEARPEWCDVPDGFRERFAKASDEWRACQVVMEESFRRAVPDATGQWGYDQS